MLRERTTDCTLVEEDWWRIEGCVSCPLPGYLILTPKPEAISFTELPAESLAALGLGLSVATRLIEETLDPEVVYCARFGEEDRTLHFHLFPRTAWITDQYRRAFRLEEDAPIHGPVLLDWAREELAAGEAATRETRAVLVAMKELLRAWRQTEQLY